MHDLAVSSVTVLPCGEILRHTDVIHILPDFLAVTYNQFNWVDFQYTNQDSSSFESRWNKVGVLPQGN